MRKSAVSVPEASSPSSAEAAWLPINEISTLEITSEDPQFPIENALESHSSGGWRAAAKGPQLLRFNFDKPTSIQRIRLHFVETFGERCQEITIYARSSDKDLYEVRRQQFTFSPGGSTEEIEDFTVDLASVTTIEFRIDPDRAHDPTHSRHHATLKSLRLA